MLHKGLIVRPCRILILTLIRVAVIRLGVTLRPCCNLALIHPDSIIFYDGSELVQDFALAVARHAGVVSVIPCVHTTDKIVADDFAIGHESAAMHTSAIEHAVTLTVWPTDDDKVNSGHSCMDESAGIDLGPGRNSYPVHPAPVGCMYP